MSKERKFIIEALIIHKVDHKKVELSDLLTPVPDEQTGKFLEKHIISSREYKYTKQAIFVSQEEEQTKPGNENDDQGGVKDKADHQKEKMEGHGESQNNEKPNEFQKICDLILDIPGDELITDNSKSTNQFIEQSRCIADELFKAVKGNQSISAGDLVVCAYRDNHDSPRQLALLKMDPEVGYVGERVVQNKKAKIVLHRREDVLPTKGLQKCAFIFPREIRAKNKYDLEVLDKQQGRYGLESAVASFFMKKFLHCKVRPTPEDETIIYVDESVKFVEKMKKEEEFTEEEANDFIDQLIESLDKPSINIADQAKDIIKKPQKQEEYVSALKSKGVSISILKPVASVKEKITEYFCFEGDDDLKVRIKADAVGAPGSGKTLEYDNEKEAGKWTITIKSIKWEKKISKKGRC
jgi:hypothetical protein